MGIYDFTGSGTSWSAVINANEITQDILDKGEVAVYLNAGSGFIYKLAYAMGSLPFLNTWV